MVAELLRTLAFMLTGMNDDQGSLRACAQALDLWKRSGRHGKVVRSSIDRLFMSWLASCSALGLEGEADIALAIQDINAEAEHARFDIMRFLCAIDLDRAAPELVERVRGLLPQLQPLGFGVLVPAIQICLVLHALRQDQCEEAARYILAMSFDRCPFSPVVVQQVTERLTHAVVASPTPLLRQTLHHYLRGLQKLWKAFKRPHLRHAVSEHLADLTQRQMIP